MTSNDTQNVAIQVLLTAHVSIIDHSGMMVASIEHLNKTIEWTIEVRERKKYSSMLEHLCSNTRTKRWGYPMEVLVI